MSQFQRAITEIAVATGLILLDIFAPEIGIPATVATMLGTAGAGLALSGIGTLLTKGPLTGLGTASRNPIAPWNVIYGRTRVGGTIVFIEETGESDKYLHMVLALACHPCQSIDALLFEGKRVALDPSGNSVSFGDGPGVQQTQTIAKIVRSHNVVTVTLVTPMTPPGTAIMGPNLMDGDQVNIHNVTGDLSLNGVYTIGVIDDYHITYISYGLDATIIGPNGYVTTMWTDWGDTVHMETVLGNHTSTFPGLLATDDTGSQGLWTSNHLMLGKTAAYLRLKFGGNTYVNGLPAIAFLLHGKADILDPRTATNAYTENAALCIADYLSNTVWGFKAVYGTEIPEDALTAAANICDEAVTLASGNTEPRYACNGQFPLTMRRGEVLQNLLTSCAGRLTYTGGQFVIHPASWEGVTASIRKDGNAGFGNNPALYITGDWSAGLWIKLPQNAHGALIGTGNAGESFDATTGSPYPYLLTVVGGPSTFNIEYVHDGVGGSGHEYLVFNTAIPVDTWIYVGASRNSTAKTVTVYTSDGVSILFTGTLSYSLVPGNSNVSGAAAGSIFMLGMLNYTSMSGTPSNSLFYPAISIIERAYMWNANLTSAQHLAAAGGSPPAGVVFEVDNMGATPPVSTGSAGTITATLTGTTAVPGRSSPVSNTARIFGEVVVGSGTSPVISYAQMTGPFQWKSKLAVRDLYNGVKGTFISPMNNWQSSDFPYYAQDTFHGYSSDANLTADGGDRRWLDTQFPFTISSACAQRLAKIELMRRRQQGTGTFAFNMALYQTTVLDVLQVTLPILGWTNKLLEISSHRFTVTKQQNQDGSEVTALGTEIDVQETDPTVYDWSVSEELTSQGYAQAAVVPNTTNVTAPTTVTATSGPSTSLVGSDGIAHSRILVTWSAPQDGYVTNGGHTEVQYQLYSSPVGTAWTAAPDVDPTSTSTYLANVVDGSQYVVQVRFVNTAGAASSWVMAGPVTVSGQSSAIAPSIITQAGATTGQVLSWNGTTWVPTTPTGGTGGGSANFLYEVPAGTLNGTNTTFTLTHVPNPAASLLLFLNGVEQDGTVDYTISGSTITYTVPPKTADEHYAYYTISGGGSGGGGSVSAASPYLSSGGTLFLASTMYAVTLPTITGWSAIASGTGVLGTTANGVVTFDSTTGTQQWACSGTLSFVQLELVAHHSQYLVNNASAGDWWGVYVYDSANGRIWSFSQHAGYADQIDIVYGTWNGSTATLPTTGNYVWVMQGVHYSTAGPGNTVYRIHNDGATAKTISFYVSLDGGVTYKLAYTSPAQTATPAFTGLVYTACAGTLFIYSQKTT